MTCPCPTIDGYRIRGRSCPVHGEADARVAAEVKARAEADAETPTAQPTEDDVDRQCAWADYRKDFGISAHAMNAAHQAFNAGWLAAREGDQSGALR